MLLSAVAIQMSVYSMDSKHNEVGKLIILFFHEKVQGQRDDMCYTTLVQQSYLIRIRRKQVQTKTDTAESTVFRPHRQVVAFIVDHYWHFVVIVSSLDLVAGNTDTENFS